MCQHGGWQKSQERWKNILIIGGCLTLIKKGQHAECILYYMQEKNE